MAGTEAGGRGAAETVSELFKKMKTYYILSVNCDCGSHKEARTNLPKGVWGSARCRYCGKMLGLMEWKVLGKIKALGDLDALNKFKLALELRKEKEV